MDWVSAPIMQFLVRVNHAAGDDTDKKGAALTATHCCTIPLGPLGLFAHNFVHGNT